MVLILFILKLYDAKYIQDKWLPLSHALESQHIICSLSHFIPRSSSPAICVSTRADEPISPLTYEEEMAVCTFHRLHNTTGTCQSSCGGNKALGPCPHLPLPTIVLFVMSR